MGLSQPVEFFGVKKNCQNFLSCLQLLAQADFLEFYSQEIDASEDNLWLEHELPSLGLLSTLYRNFNPLIVVENTAVSYTHLTLPTILLV